MRKESAANRISMRPSDYMPLPSKTNDGQALHARRPYQVKMKPTLLTLKSVHRVIFTFFEKGKPVKRLIHEPSQRTLLKPVLVVLKADRRGRRRSYAPMPKDGASAQVKGTG